MLIEWSPALETGVRVIDRQHEELVAMINELDTVRREGTADALEDIMQRLDAYIIFHFGTEEAMMAGLHQPPFMADLHCREHREFIAQFAQLRQRAMIDNRPGIDELANYLGQWIFEHILKADRSLAVMLKQRMADTRRTSPKP